MKPKVLTKCPDCSSAMWRGTTCSYCFPFRQASAEGVFFSPYRMKARAIAKRCEREIGGGWQFDKIALILLHGVYIQSVTNRGLCTRSVARRVKQVIADMQNARQQA